jgi:hypothetical protein
MMIEFHDPALVAGQTYNPADAGKLSVSEKMLLESSFSFFFSFDVGRSMFHALA